MRLLIAALLPLAVSAFSPSAAVNDVKQLKSRQNALGTLPLLFGSTFDNFPKLQKVQTEELQPKLRTDAKRIRIRWGPVKAYAANDPRPGYVSLFPSTDADNPSDTGFANTISAIPTDITMLWARVDLQNEAGQAASSAGIYLHHLFFYHLNSRKIRKEFCYGKSRNWVGAFSKTTPSVMLGGGSGDHDKGDMFTTPDGTFNSGYYLPKDARFMVQGEVVNTFNTTQYLYPTLEVEYVPGKQQNLKDVSMMMFSVTNCTVENPTIAFLPPKNKTQFDITSDKFPLPEDGYIINAVGHMHDGGKNITARLNGKPICESIATYGIKGSGASMPMGEGMHMRRHGPSDGEHQTIIKMTECANVIPVKKGDIIDLRAFYDLDAQGPRMASGHELGVMGIFVMYFAAKEPTVKRASLGYPEPA